MSITSRLPSHPGLFIGREAELAEIGQLLAEPACRLLTLVGPGGSGKTRLAVQLASERQSDFENGVFFVPLVQLGSADHILPAIVTGLGLHVEAQETLKQQLLDYLRPRQMLLVLDNFEHLLDGAELVAEILDTAPEVKIVTTSREALKLQEEWVRYISGLPFPAYQEIERLEDYAAVQLFAECTRRTRKDFSLASERAHVIRICQLVEGLPLGIELATAWLRTLTYDQVIREIQRNIDFLSTPLRNVPERHRSMRAVFEHSLKLLRGDEQTIFAKLSVFRGGFTQEAAEAVAGATVLALSALVDKSLLRLTATGRYDIHELLRQYGGEQLEVSGHSDPTRDAHSAYYLDFVRQWEPQIKGRGQVEALAALDTDFENIRVAWNWAVEQKQYAALDAALETLSIFSSEDMRSDSSAYLELLRQAWERFTPSFGSEPPPVLWHIRAHYFLVMFRSDEATVELERCLEVARRQRDPAQVALCLTALAWVHLYVYRDHRVAIRCLDESNLYYRKVKDNYNLARNFIALSVNYLLLGQVAERDEFGRHGFELSRQTGDKARIGQSLQVLAANAAEIGDAVVARRLFQEALDVWREMGFLGAVAHVNARISLSVHFSGGDLAAAKTLGQDALKVARDSNYLYWGVRVSLYALGFATCIEEEYVAGQQLLEESIPLTEHTPLLSGFLDLGLAIAACGLKDYPAVHRSLPAAMEYAACTHMLQLMVWCLPVAAVLDAQDSHPQRSVELLGLASIYPTSLTGWMYKWPLLNRLRAELESELGREGYAVAWQAGQALELESVISKILDRLRPTLPPSRARQTLTDPLSGRELEVLHLIADGLSNREIADQLVVGMSTVSKHINHIYSKLAATSRMQAVVRARALKLL